MRKVEILRFRQTIRFRGKALFLWGIDKDVDKNKKKYKLAELLKKDTNFL